MIRAVGDLALVEDDASIWLLDQDGVVAEWPREDILDVVVLADPPRLAILRSLVDGNLNRAARTQLELVDCATGSTTCEVGPEENIDAAIAFAPGGTSLYVNARQQLAIVDEAGAVRVVAGGPLATVDALYFSADGRAAIGRTQLSRNGPVGVFRIDVDDRGAATTTWVKEAYAGRSMVVDDAFTRVALYVMQARRHALEMWNTKDGARTATLLDEFVGRPPYELGANRAFSRFGVLARRAEKRSFWDRDGVITVVDASPPRPDDGLWPSTRPPTYEGFVYDALVDVERGRVLHVGDDDERYGANLRSLTGEVRCRVPDATQVCFANNGAGDAVALKDGALFVLRPGAAPYLVEGHGALSEIATHARGVIAFDEDARACVVELDANAPGDAP